MNPMRISFVRAAAAALLLAVAGAPGITHAAPGAHGPNGEHLDAPAGTTAGGSAAPRFEARSEAFELVGRLSGGELSLMINRYETGEPVLEAQVEVESGPLKAAAPFRGDLGDYVVADEAFRKAVSASGEHPIVVTVVAGDDADLLEGTLVVAAASAQAAAAADHGHDHGPGGEHAHAHTWWEELRVPLAGLALAAVAFGAWFARRRRRAAPGGVQ